MDTWTEIQRPAYSNPSLCLDRVIKRICHFMLLHFISWASFKHKQIRDHASITLWDFYSLVFPRFWTAWFTEDFLSYIKYMYISIALTMKKNWQVYKLMNLLVDQRCRLRFVCYTHQILVLPWPCSRTPAVQCHCISSTPGFHTPGSAGQWSAPPGNGSPEWKRQSCTTAAKRSCTIVLHQLHGPCGKSLPDSWL